ncbi:AAA family ATPase [Arthrobacter sp. JUb115]|uniref:AAA family ATPase n=1 Tax=Arthrobacter sp. JUb115 TaxID=2485108 RepID=UPI00105C5788|nr:AAA family ATPase [Arthrobacter sp. JUb115]TDU23383.1 AAA ATPase-like protein [Arthrobacter sp. JUb115]
MYWEISNFKGLAKANIDLKPGSTTLITGVNSSGKSSLIQSLLMTAQSLYRTGPVVLNGSLTRLGKPSELVRADSPGKTMSLKIDLNTDFYDSEVESPEQAFAEIQLSSDQNQSNLQVTRIILTELYEDIRRRDILFDSAHIKKQTLIRLKSILPDLDDFTALHLKQDSETDEKSKPAVYLVLQGLIAKNIVVLSNEKTISSRYSRGFRDTFENDASQASHEASLALLDSRYTYVRETIDLLEQSFQEGTPDAKRLLSLMTEDSEIPHLLMDQLLRGSGENIPEILKQTMAQRAKRPYVVLEFPSRFSRRKRGFSPTGIVEKYYTELLSTEYSLIDGMRGYLMELGKNLNYIGPLRDEPRVLWSHWNELSRGLPVGAKGEYSAAVLNRFANRKVTYRQTLDSSVREEPLKDAINYWLNKLEISDGATSKSQGKLGVGIEVEIDGEGRDLTSVGVGVSQALPIIIGLLMAPRSGIFIVEQPELHLHPNAQALLADFLITSRPDVSVLVETHSEAMITRIRRRVAEESLSPDEVDIVFIESTIAGGVGRSLRVGSYGDLSEWPNDFLSATQDDIRAIMKSNSSRIRKSKSEKVK